MERLTQLSPPVLVALSMGALVWVLLPTLVAVLRRRRDFLAILGLNVAFFFSLTVWFPLLVWAATGRSDQTLVARLDQAGPTRWIGWGIILGLVVAVAYACFEAVRFLAGS